MMINALKSNCVNTSTVLSEKSILELYPSSIRERIDAAVDAVNVSIRNDDRRFTEISSRKIGKQLNALHKQWKMLMKNNEELEARKVQEEIDVYTVLLYVRKKIGNDSLLEDTLGIAYRIELEKDAHSFLNHDSSQ